MENKLLENFRLRLKSHLREQNADNVSFIITVFPA